MNYEVLFSVNHFRKKNDIKYHLAREKKILTTIVMLWWAGRDSGDSWSTSYSPVNQNLKLSSRGVETRGVSGVTGSVELNHVESACGENPNTSPLTPGRPVRPTTQTNALTHRPRPVPTFCLFEVEPARPITNWTWGPAWGVGVANI